jgi:hypothetical protein
MDRQRSADFFEVRERAYGAAAVGAKRPFPLVRVSSEVRLLIFIIFRD